jgi:hypothetical protein
VPVVTQGQVGVVAGTSATEEEFIGWLVAYRERPGFSLSAGGVGMIWGADEEQYAREELASGAEQGYDVTLLKVYRADPE